MYCFLTSRTASYIPLKLYAAVKFIILVISYHIHIYPAAQIDMHELHCLLHFLVTYAVQNKEWTVHGQVNTLTSVWPFTKVYGHFI